MKSKASYRLVLLRNIRPLVAALFAAFAFGFSPSAHAGLECGLVPGLFKIYLSNHYAIHEFDEEIAKRTVELFIKQLDPSKVLLLESDVADLRKKLNPAMVKVVQGKCDDFEKTKDLLLSRAKENEAKVREILGSSYKLDETAEIQLDPDKRGYAKDSSERDQYLKKYVHFQILNYLLSDRKMEDAKKALIHRYELVVKRIQEQKPVDTYNAIANSFANSLDPHSTYLWKSTFEDFEMGMKLSLEGIGAVLSSQDGYTVVEEIIPGGGADRSKQMSPKDKIIAVKQEGEPAVNVIDMDLNDVVRMIRGKKGTKVTLTILRQAEKTDRFEVAILRDKIDIKDQAAKINYETRKVGDKTLKYGIIDLPSFYGEGRAGKRSSATDVKKLLEEAKTQKVDGIVLNLSRNGGGLLSDAVDISGLFLKKGGIVATQDTKRRVEVIADRESDTVYSGPLVVLTSRLSASASEILAGALKDYKRAVIIGGDHTFGKGTVQVVNPFPGDLGAMKITTGMFFLPSGRSTQHSGVQADIQLPSTYNRDDIGERALDYSLGEQKIPAFVADMKEADEAQGPGRWEPIENSVVEKLAAKSKARVAKEEAFTEILKDIAEAEKNRGVVKLADIRSRTETEKKKEKKDEKKKRSEKQKDLDAPYVGEAINILTDLMVEQGKVSVSKFAAVPDTKQQPKE